MKFLARIKDVSTKRTVDVAKVTRILLETEEAVAGRLDDFEADQNVWITVEVE